MNIDVNQGYFFEEKCIFTADELREMAYRCGDMNFIHHDEEAAKKTRFKNIIASGSAIAAYFTALIPTHFSKLSPMLGLDMSLKFPAPIYPDTELTMRWQVTSTTPKPDNSLVVSLEGSVKNEEGDVLVLGQGNIMLLEKL